MGGSRDPMAQPADSPACAMQGMVTNDVRPLEQAGSPPVYAAILTAKGKLLHDIIMYREEGSDREQSVLVEADARRAEQAQALLKRYKMKRQVAVEDAANSHAVWVAFGGGAAQEAAGPGPEPPLPPVTSGKWHVDPRLPALGWRAVLSGQQPTSSSSSSGMPPAPSSEEEAYVRWRCLHGVAEGSLEMPTDEAVPLEYSLDVLNGVSYTKGCYVGQERMSYGHYRGITRRRCIPFRLEGGEPGVRLPAGSPVVVQGSGESAGTVRVHAASGDVGLAVLKLSAVLAAEAGQVKLAPGVGRGVLVPQRPSWWSPDWGREE